VCVRVCERWLVGVDFEARPAGALCPEAPGLAAELPIRTGTCERTPLARVLCRVWSVPDGPSRLCARLCMQVL